MKKLLLTIIFILTLANPIFASDLSTQIINAKCVTEYDENATVDDFDTVIFGSYPQNSAGAKEPIEWIVLDKNDNSAYLLSKKIIAAVPYDISYSKKYKENMDEQSLNANWEDSIVRKWLNNDFYNAAFSNNEKKLITEASLGNGEYTAYNKNRFIHKSMNDTFDNIFLIGLSDIDNYLPSINNRIAYRTKKACDMLNEFEKNDPHWTNATYEKNKPVSYGLRDIFIGTDDENDSFSTGSTVKDNGSISISNLDLLNGFPTNIRPAMWVSYDAIDSNLQIDDNIQKEDLNEANDTVTWGMNGIDATFRVADLKEGWVYDVEGKKFYFNTFDPNAMSANFPTNCWKEIDGKNYYFTNYGYVLINTITPDGFQVDENGVMILKNGWQGDYYYENGNVVKNVWKQYGSDWYYLGSTGVVEKNKWIGEFYVDGTGKMLKSTTTPDGYQVDADGKKIIVTTTIKENANTSQYSDSIFVDNNEIDYSQYDYDKPPKFDESQIVLSLNDIKSATGKEFKDNYDQMQYVINLTLTNNGKQKFKEATERNIGNVIYIIYNDKILSYPTVQDVVSDGKCQIAGLSNLDEAKDLAKKIKNKEGKLYFVEGELRYPLKNENKNLNKENDDLIKISSIWDKITEDKNKEQELKTNIYYYAKQESKDNKIYNSIKKTSKRDGWFGTGLFAKTSKTYYSIEVKLNEETTERLSKYADFNDRTFSNGYQWILLFGNNINKLEYGCSISPHSDDESLALTEGLTYYQSGTIYISCDTKKEQDTLYNKINNSQNLIIATNNVVKSCNVKYFEEKFLGGFTRFERQKAVEGLNWVTGYVDCEDEIIDYSKNHIGYSIYAKDGYDGSIVYKEDIEVPITSCKLFNIFTYGQDSLEYAMYANHVNFLGKNTSAAVNQFVVYGGKVEFKYDLDLSKGFKDYEIYYNHKNQ